MMMVSVLTRIAAKSCRRRLPQATRIGLLAEVMHRFEDERDREFGVTSQDAPAF